LRALKEFGHDIVSNFTEPKADGITKETLVRIISFLDEKYLFTEKVFRTEKAIFALMPYSNRCFNSQCLIARRGTAIIPHFLLYCMREESKANPIAVLFHELGHALHAQRFGAFDYVPDEILDFLTQLCIPTLKELDAATQTEIFADVIGIGLMYQSQFEEYDLFPFFHVDDKKALKGMVEKILSEL
jgi:hypothetical protein